MEEKTENSPQYDPSLEKFKSREEMLEAAEEIAREVREMTSRWEERHKVGRKYGVFR